MAKELYTDGAYLRNNPTWHAEDSEWKAGQILQMLARNRLTPRSIAEVGCGAGGILAALRKRMPTDCSFTGFEISPQAYEMAKVHASDRLHFVLGDALADDRTWDLVMCIDIIEHMEDYFTFLRGIRGRGTHKLLHIPLDLSAQTVFRGTPLVAGRKSIGHIHYFTKDIALAMLAEVGYDVVDHFYTPGGLELSHTSLKTRLAAPIRKLAFKLNNDLAVRTFAGYSLMVLAR